MHPILIELGGFSIKTYGFLIAIGFALGLFIALREARRVGLSVDAIGDLAFYILLGAIVGSRLYYILTNLDYFKQHPLDMFKIWEGGLTFFGGFMLAVILCVWMIRKHHLPVWKTLDVFAPSLAVGVFFGRLGCFSAGCCYGKACDLPWAVTFTHPLTLARSGIALHPTQLYSALGAAITFILLYSLRKRKTFYGQLTLLWALCYSCERMITEQFRGDIRGGMLADGIEISFIIAVIIIIASLILYPVLKKRNSIAPAPTKKISPDTKLRGRT
jgi:phosphatidylglycerol---prolipoprotein diacylglyceryl transferase